MTNYNERLDKILEDFYDGDIRQSDMGKSRQALTSLIKELVAEAKPGIPEEYERDDALYIGFERGTEYYYDAISNLLKALEEEV